MFELTMGPDDLGRVLRRLNDSAADTLHIYVVEPIEGEIFTRAANTQAACGAAFAQLVGVEPHNETVGDDESEAAHGRSGTAGLRQLPRSVRRRRPRRLG